MCYCPREEYTTRTRVLKCIYGFVSQPCFSKPLPSSLLHRYACGHRLVFGQVTRSSTVAMATAAQGWWLRVALASVVLALASSSEDYQHFNPGERRSKITYAPFLARLGSRHVGFPSRMKYLFNVGRHSTHTQTAVTYLSTRHINRQGYTQERLHLGHGPR